MKPEDQKPEEAPSYQSPNAVEDDRTDLRDKPVVDADNERDTSTIDTTTESDVEKTSPLAVTPTEPEETTTPATGTPMTTAAKSKKPLLIVLAAVLVALLAGGYSAYALWWNKPEKVVDDSLASVMTAKSGTAVGTLDIAGEGSPTFKLTFDSKSVEAKTQTSIGAKTTIEGKVYGLSANLVTDKDTYYAKLSDLKKTLSSIYGDSQVMEIFDPIVSKIDGKWVVITPDDVKRLSGDQTASNKEMTCVQNVIQGIRSNKAQQKELADVYQKNRFIVVKESKGVESVDGKQSNHYVLNVDNAKAKSFGNELKKTSVFKAVDNCVAEDLSKSTDQAESKVDSSNDPTIELWVDKWSHKPTKLKITSNSKDETKLTFESKFNLGSKVTIDTPKADTTVKDIETEIQNLQQQFSAPAESEFTSSEF